MATPLQRPEAFTERKSLTDEEAKALDVDSKKRTLASERLAIELPNEVGDYNAAFKEDSRSALPTTLFHHHGPQGRKTAALHAGS